MTNTNKKAFISIFAIFFSAIVVSVLTAIYILLLKQIEILDIEYASFQSMYTADSAFECIIYKEQTATGTNSVFLPTNKGNLGSCGVSGDIVWAPDNLSNPEIINGRAKSTLNFSISTNQGDFCAIINIDKETRDTSTFLTAPDPNYANISGQNKECSATPERVVERLLELYF